MEIINEGNRFPGVVKVEYFDMQKLISKNIDIDFANGIEVSSPEGRIDIPLIEPGTAVSKSKDGSEECTLSFSSQKKIDPKFRPGFIFTDANGDEYMIASSCKPYPRVEIQQSFGKLPDERPDFEYTVYHQALKTPVRVDIE